MQYNFKITDSGIDLYYDYITDCLPKIAYVLYKNRFSDSINYLISNMNDMTFNLATTDSDELVDFGFTKSLRWNNYVKYNHINTTSGSAIKTLLALLDEGHTPIVFTVYPLLKFSPFYAPDTNVDTYQPAHAFLLLHYDQENYYFFDSIAVNFTPYKENKEIGVIKRNEADPIFEKLLKLDLITYDASEEQDLRVNIQSILDIYITRFTDKSQKHIDSYVIRYGAAAYEKMIDICEHEKPLLSKPARLIEGASLGKLIAWKAMSIVGTKAVAALWLDRYGGNAGKETNHVLKKTIDLWNIVKNKISKDTQNTKTRLDERYLEHFYNIYLYENELYKKMRHFLTHNRVY